MNILIIHGPNLNLLGIRNHKHYGHQTMADINDLLSKKAKEIGVNLIFFQSNHEGDLIDFIQQKSGSASGILVNPGALTHYGYSLRDALTDSNLPVVEVHLSDIENREDFRKVDAFDGIVVEKVMGLQEESYILGLEKLVSHIRNNPK